MTAVRAGEDSRKARRRVPVWLELPLVVLAAILLAFLVKTFIVQIFFIPSGSMENTLMVGDRVAVNRFVYRFSEPQRGDIVVFDGIGSFLPESHQQPSQGPVRDLFTELGRTVGLVPPPDTVFVKRVVGVPGDRVECCDDKGRIKVNDRSISESEYLFSGNTPSDTAFNVVVPPGKLWVMGDHRRASADSRAHLDEPGGGFVPESRVLGKAFAVVWPPSRAQFLPSPQWADNLGPAPAG